MRVSWGHEGRESVLLFKDQDFLFPLEAFIFWMVSCAFREHGGLIPVPAPDPRSSSGKWRLLADIWRLTCWQARCGQEISLPSLHVHSVCQGGGSGPALHQKQGCLLVGQLKGWISLGCWQSEMGGWVPVTLPVVPGRQITFPRQKVVLLMSVEMRE